MPPLTNAELERDSARAIEAIARRWQYCSYGAVAAEVCAMHGATRLDQLGASNPTKQSKELARVWRAQQLIDAHLAAFFAMRCVACYHALERELVTMLNGFGMFRPPRADGDDANPEEIVIDEEPAKSTSASGASPAARARSSIISSSRAADAGATPPKTETQSRAYYFTDFGLGPFSAIPAVASRFPSMVEFPTMVGGSIAGVHKANPIRDLGCVLRHLRWLLENHSLSDGDTYRDFVRRLDDEKGYFEDGKEEDWDIDNGVYINWDVPVRDFPEMQMAAHVDNARSKTERALADEAKAAEARAERAERAAKAETRPPPPPRLKGPRDAKAKAFVARVVKRLETPWRPSRAKALSAIRAEWPGVDEEMVAAATEYAMVHLGGGRYRAKVFDLTGDAEDEDAKTSAGEEDDEDDVEGEPPTEENAEEAAPETTDARGENAKENRGGDGDDIPAAPGKRRKTTARAPFEGRLAVSASSSRTVFPTKISTADVRAHCPWWNDVEISDNRAVGRWGESLVYHYLLSRHVGWRVTWMNEEKETKSFYDIKLESADGAETIFVEVKTTKFGDKNVFEMSPWEWDFAQKPGVSKSYHIYRVYGAGDVDKVRVEVVKDPARLVREHEVRMCLAI